ncbi:tyrosine recombinase XerD [Paenibacillus antibioticophila]|uniref:Tyrosine recombinase XerC n=1 Tax=Paenibacillus antibioticophila TaxID=1274374 RepID=A0A919XZ64_9BACL|nr:site-specific tyrosine recombinase [Paenibacillus antibioticophila]GIO39035.1 tyrosine recombinase XerD [Paenibacillus antibioticophila]
MQQAAASFITYLTQQRKLSPSTLESYSRDIEHFLDYLTDRGISAYPELTRTGVMLYFARLREQGKAPATIARSSVALKAFLQFLLQDNIIEQDLASAITPPKLEKKLPDILSLEETQLLLEAPDDTTPLGLRDKAILELLYATAIRVSELIALNIRDVDIGVRFLRCSGDAGKERILPFGMETARWLDKYLSELRGESAFHPEQKPLFPNRSGERISRQGIWKLLKKYADRAGLVKDITPHTLRHSCAVHLLESGADVRSVQEMLGHGDLATIQLYLAHSKPNLKAVYDQFHPRARARHSDTIQ